MDFKIKSIDSSEINALLSYRPTYTLFQREGQRVYGPLIDIPEPDKGCEVFVTRIPADCYEDELVPVFESIGLIYQFRLLISPSLLTRGLAFVKYMNPFDAQKAIQMLNNFQIRSRYQLNVVLSKDNRRLIIGNIPLNMTKEEVVRRLSCATNGLKTVFVKTDGMTVIEYESHRLASMARRVFARGFRMGNSIITFEWEDPNIQINSIRTICVRNLNLQLGVQWLKSLFSCGGLRVESVKIVWNLTYIRYATRREADLALRYFTDPTNFNGFQICWAQHDYNF